MCIRDRASEELESLEKERSSFDKEVSDLQESLDEERRKLNAIKISLHEKTKDLSVEIESLEKQLEPYTTQIQEKKSEIKLVETKINMLETAHNNLLSEEKSLLKNIESIKNAQVEGSELVTSLTEESKKIARQIKIGEKECQEATRQIADMKSVLLHHRQNVAEAKANLSGFKNKNTVLDACLLYTSRCV